MFGLFYDEKPRIYKVISSMLTLLVILRTKSEKLESFVYKSSILQETSLDIESLNFQRLYLEIGYNGSTGTWCTTFQLPELGTAQT